MATIIDFRTIEPSFRHALFFSVFESLKEGAQFEFSVDHDPAPLHKQLLSLGLINLDWKYVEKGPTQWRIQVTKTAVSNPKKENCCGICSGGHGDKQKEDSY